MYVLHCLVIMSHLTCPCESCKKEIEKPIVVTNFSVTPNRVYYACPYCLTKLEFETEQSIRTTDATLCCEEKQSSKPEPAYSDESAQKIVIHKLETLEKQRAGLLSELEELRKAANKKISCLEEEVAALKEEAELLREITSD
jgi:hypothetical protein